MEEVAVDDRTLGFWRGLVRLARCAYTVPVSSYLGPLVGIVIAHLLILASPGPNFLIVVRASASRSRRAGLLAACGIAGGAAVWATAAVLGLGFLFERLAWLYGATKLLGGAYLIYLGILTWRRATRRLDALPGSEATGSGVWPWFRMGLLTNFTNPKAAVFFGSIFTALLPAGAPSWVPFAAVGVVVTNALWWHCALAFAFSAEGVQRGYRSAKGWVDRVAGGVMMLLGVRLVLSGR